MGHRNLRTFEIEPQERVKALERERLIGDCSPGVHGAAYSEGDSRRLFVQYDPNAAEIVTYLYVCDAPDVKLP